MEMPSEDERLLAALEDPRPLAESLPAHGIDPFKNLRALVESLEQRNAPRPTLTLLKGGRDDA
jgi:hypothetical protein